MEEDDAFSEGGALHLGVCKYDLHTGTVSKRGAYRQTRGDPKSVAVTEFLGELSYVNGYLIHNHVERGRKWQERKRCCKEEKEGRKVQQRWRAWSMEAKERIGSQHSKV